jgi:hypothetical protein
LISLSPQLALDESHVYSVDGRRVPGVTTVLAAERLIDSRFFTPEAAQRGTAVHAAVEQDDRGILDEAFLDPRILPYLEGWRRFKRDNGFVPKLSEIRMYSPVLDVAGTADSIGMMKGILGITLVDVKSGVPSPATSLQTAAYAAMYHELTHNIIAVRFAVQLTVQGNYKLHRYQDPNDIFIFRAALNLHRWRQKHVPAYADYLAEQETAA